MDFHIQVPAKCTLIGEHVINQRGFALVAPFKHYQLSLSYSPDSSKTSQSMSGETSSLSIILWPVVCKALELLHKNPRHLRGSFKLSCTIPPCSGLGFAAAFCVATAAWAVYCGYISQDKLFDFALQLQQVFHNKNRGLDIAGVMAKSIIKFESDKKINNLDLTWQPLLYISSSGEQTITDSNDTRIRQFYGNNSSVIAMIDDHMLEASRLANLGFSQNDYQRGLTLLTEALNLGNQCFYDWQLVSDTMEQHLQQVRQYALACKVIGAGFGGHVVSLWREKPPAQLPFKLYRLM